jgi:hypothetical protein
MNLSKYEVFKGRVYYLYVILVNISILKKNFSILISKNFMNPEFKFIHIKIKCFLIQNKKLFLLLSRLFINKLKQEIFSLLVI